MKNEKKEIQFKFRDTIASVIEESVIGNGQNKSLAIRLYEKAMIQVGL